ncbi:MAG: four helix bundle protein [Nitrospirae bacterium]|nr:four helix bundle protein [Nitrospirota bacterium]
MEFHFERLTVWQEAMELVAMVYRMTRSFPQEEKFGLVSQLQRAVVSVPANIAEGRGRYHRKEFIQFLYMARGSLYETITLLKTAGKLGYLDPVNQELLLGCCQKIGSQLSGLINSLKPA